MFHLLQQEAINDLIAIEDKKFLDTAKDIMAKSSPVQAMLDVLKSPQGFDITLFDKLSVGRYETGQYAVIVNNADQSKDDEEHLFDRPEDALDKFFELRQQLKLGYDYEDMF